MMIRRKRTALLVGGMLILVCLALEVAYFGFNAFFTALGVWVVLVGPALAVTPRRGPQDELWLFGAIRELLHWLHGKWDGGDERRGADPTTTTPSPSSSEPVTPALNSALAVTPASSRDGELWPLGLVRETLRRLDGEAGGWFHRRARVPAPIPSPVAAPVAVPASGLDPAPAESAAGGPGLASRLRGRSPGSTG